jgi:ribosome-associated toxin RatA of RatAB toxin-antitoxin module
MPAQHAEHSIEIAAPAQVVYDLIADVSRWPLMFGPTVHVEVIEPSAVPGAGTERMRIWATANGEVKTWTSRRDLDAAAHRIGFRQEVSQPPVAAMSGTWRLEPADPGTTRVALTHEFQAVGDDPDGVAWIERAIDRNSAAELTALAIAAQAAAHEPALLVSFEDTVELAVPPQRVYQFLYDAASWPALIPHVRRLDLREDTPNVQVMAMDTQTPDGSVHTTESVRVCFPDSLIVYKQTTVPALMRAHTGYWRITGDGDSTTAVAGHAVVLNPEAVVPVLGADATIADAAAFVRRALGTNSTTTLRRAQETAADGDLAGSRP